MTYAEAGKSGVGEEKIIGRTASGKERNLNLFRAAVIVLLPALVFLCCGCAAESRGGQSADGAQTYRQEENGNLPGRQPHVQGGESPDAEPEGEVGGVKNDISVTFMVYMDASTLESEGEPFATYDLEQMMQAELSGQVRVIVQTGGTRRWGRTGAAAQGGMPADRQGAFCEAGAGTPPVSAMETEARQPDRAGESDMRIFVTDTSEISAESTQRYEVVSGGMILLEDTGAQKDMTDGQTLREFITYCAKQAPADRYFLLLWGHGRGPETGYGLDDFQDFESAMTLDAIGEAIGEASAECGIRIEMIGFDVCLMGNLETVYALRGCCDYLAVSEDYEPAYGWQYTEVLNALSQEPDIEMERFSQMIVQAYMEEAERSGDRGIIAVIDMQYAEALWRSWRAFYDKNVAMMEYLTDRVWHDEGLLTPVPTGVNGYVSDDGKYSLQDYGLTDVRALLELAPSEEAGHLTELLERAVIAVDSYHMARTMCGLAVCP